MAQSQGIRARLLGSFDLTLGGVAIDRGAFERPSGLRLLKLLLATPGHRLRREAAAEALWPEMDPDRSGAALRKAIHFARRALATAGPGADASLVADGEAIALASLAHLEVDADGLAAALSAIEDGHATPADLATLAELGGTELLPDDPYEEWLVPLRERLAQRTLGALLRAATGARTGGDPATAMRLVDVLLGREPADEAAHRLAIELYLETGQLHAARRQLQQARSAVQAAYGVEPDAALDQLVAEAAARRPERGSALAGASEAPIVGRLRELGASEDAFDDVAAGGSTALVLRGPAGIGKSRLLREVASLARASSWNVIEMRGLEGSPGERFATVGAAIARALGDAVDDLEEPARSAVLTTTPGAAMARRSTGRRRPPGVEFASDQGVIPALADALVPPGAAGPIAVVLDDAQWLDSGSLDVLLAAVRLRRPLLVAATVRDEPAHLEAVRELLELARRDSHDVRLAPLGAREIQALLERELGGERLDDEPARQVAELAAGVPLFALEVLRAARETGLVERRDGRWIRRRGAEAMPVPAGVSLLVDRRVERLGADHRRVLAVAAELGDHLAFEDLVATGLDPDGVLDAVDMALAESLVVEVSGRYAFAHPLYRAALKTGLRARDRADVHRRIAATLAAGADASDLDQVRRLGAGGVEITTIADHAADAVELGRTELTPLAVGFGIGAGERRASLFDFAGAVRTIRRALRLWQRLPMDARAAFAISHAQVELGEALRRINDDAGAAAAFRAALDAATSDAELATAASAASWLPYERGRFAQSLETLTDALGRIQDPVARASLESARGWIIGRSGAWDTAEPILLDAVAVLEVTGPSPVLMRALDRAAIAVSNRDPAASMVILDRALGMARELGHTGELATYEMHLAGSLRDLGRLDEAVEALDRAQRYARQSGEQYIASVTAWISAEVQQTRGDDLAAIGHRREELEILGRIGGNPRHEALAHAHIAHLARRLGDPDLEASEARLARTLARHSGTPELEPRVEWALTTPDWFADQPVWDAPAGVGGSDAAARPTGP